jgi:hypothetical protein
MTSWLEERSGVEGLVHEGERALAWVPEGLDKTVIKCSFGKGLRPPVRCDRVAVMEVYCLEFCEIHGEECKGGALEELYFDAEQFLDRLDNPHVSEPNPEALRVLREGISELSRAASTIAEEGDEALVRAFPLTPESEEAGRIALCYPGLFRDKA